MSNVAQDNIMAMAEGLIEWASFPEGAAYTIADELARFTKAPVRGVELDLLGLSTMAQARGWWNERAGGADAMIDGAKQLLEEIDQKIPDFWPALTRTGASNSAVIVRLVAEQAAILRGLFHPEMI